MTVVLIFVLQVGVPSMPVRKDFPLIGWRDFSKKTGRTRR
jgi:hypothetical protein